MKLKTFSAVIGAAALASTIAFADEAIPNANDGFTEVGKEGSWTVYTDGQREVCLMQRTYEGGHVVQVGHTRGMRKAYLGAFAKIPDEFRGKKHTEKVTLVVGDEALVNKKIKRRARNADTPYTGAYVENKDIAYFGGQAMAVQQFDYEGEQYVLEYKLDGLAEAIDALAKCDAALG